MCLCSVKLTMQCARLHLQERLRPKMKESRGSPAKPRRYCQKRMINPEHDEDPRWADVMKRFHCNTEEPEREDAANETIESINTQDAEDMFLSVQTLQFQGDVEQTKRSRTSFKYKTDTIRHRMFVKQVVQDNEYSDDEERSSELTSYYFDDYVKYLFVDKSRPTSGKSSLFLQGLGNKKERTIHFNEDTKDENNKPSLNIEPKPETQIEKEKERTEDDNTKITYSNSGKRKSLTISRTQSPETVQVIRVDVVCNYSCNSALSNYDERTDLKNNKHELDDIDLKKPHFSNKYLLTNTIKSLDENLSGGSKVTLLCKTFTLSERSRRLNNKKQSAETKSNNNSKSKKNTKSIKFPKKDCVSLA